ncbi:Hypothetical predicted protein [Mytilus galloprovincialis]|uniref:Ig-like domain-containing protein n=1 Tax=Mytilus galloprovincialis TaxID=29158 RepID=A0A8B6FUS0_MYTGA|nr:Hypothetical predicted protein [Mytilus galloprovincialis]
MKTTCAFRSWTVIGVIMYLADASMVRYIYYLEGSTVVLKCLSYSERMEWFGTAHTKIYRQIQVSDMFGHRRMWNITLYTDCQFIIPTLPNRNRLRKDNFDLQIINASILDEGLYFYGTSFYSYDGVWYILQMINASRIGYIYYPEGSTVTLKCLLDMEWFGPAHFNSFYQSSVFDMHKNCSNWTTNRYTEGNKLSRSLPHHSRLKVIRKQQTGDYKLQIRNASLFDEGLYFCENSEMHAVPDYSILQLTSKLTNEDRTTVSSMHGMVEEINEGETKELCCYVDNNLTFISLKWLKGKRTMLVSQNVNKTCYIIIRVRRYDQGNYTCIAENVIGSGTVTVFLKVKSKYSLQNVVIPVLLGTIATLVVGIGIIFLHKKRTNNLRRMSTIDSETQRENDGENGHYMEIDMIDENIVTQWQENNNPITSTVERAVVENRDMALISTRHSPRSSDNDINVSVDLDDDYEHAYNTLVANNPDEDTHVYLTPKTTSNMQ